MEINSGLEHNSGRSEIWNGKISQKIFRNVLVPSTLTLNPHPQPGFKFQKFENQFSVQNFGNQFWTGLEHNSGRSEIWNGKISQKIFRNVLVPSTLTLNPHPQPGFKFQKFENQFSVQNFGNQFGLDSNTILFAQKFGMEKSHKKYFEMYYLYPQPSTLNLDIAHQIFLKAVWAQNSSGYVLAFLRPPFTCAFWC